MVSPDDKGSTTPYGRNYVFRRVVSTHQGTPKLSEPIGWGIVEHAQDRPEFRLTPTKATRKNLEPYAQRCGRRHFSPEQRGFELVALISVGLIEEMAIAIHRDLG